MMLPGGLQVRIKSPSDADESAIVSSWTLPVYGVADRSVSIMMAIGQDLVVMRPRIAQALGIRDGQIVEFEMVHSPGVSLRAPVKIKEALCSDVLIHDLVHLCQAKSSLVSSHAPSIVSLHSGKHIRIDLQSMWAGMRVVPRSSGTALLHIDGASRNNPHGPSGYGFRISKFHHDDELVQGYGFGGMNRSSNEMEYEALLEGLVWVDRLNCQKVIVCSDSELVVKQVMGEYQVRHEALRKLHAKAIVLVDRIKEYASFRILHIPRKQNLIADCLANMGVDTRENVTVCNWGNVNRFIEACD